MKTITVNASSSYNIIIGKDLLSDAGTYCLDALKKICKIFQASRL